MKPGIAISLFISIILIGGAFWTRIDASKNEAGLVAVANQDPNEDFYKDVFLNPSVDPTPASTSTTPQGPLTGTDLVGRQLIMDYVDLAAMGQASDINIELLAERYAESIPTLVNVQKIGYLDIKTVANNLENLRVYSNELLNLYVQYYTNTKSLPTINPASQSLDSNYLVYIKETQQTADLMSRKLKEASVPIAVSALHIELINIHLEKSAAAVAIQEMDKDPLLAMAGIITLNKNLDEEINTLKKMEQLFEENGI